MKRIQDSVHGLIEFSGRESLALDALGTPELQRLRHVRQLGLAHLVYPAAEHSRFAHAIGAAHIASRFARSLRHASRELLAPGLQVDESVARDLVLAGLCHDLGHGPLSHAWERYVMDGWHLERWKRKLEIPPRPWIEGSKLKWHELVTQACLLSKDSQLHCLLEDFEKGLSDRVAAILGDHYYLQYVSRLISSDVDIDRADFVIRDAMQTGVAYGRYDVNWLVSTLTIGFRQSDDKDIPVAGFDLHKASRAVEQFLVAHSALYETVYFHTAVQSAETMVGKLLALVGQHSDAGSLGFSGDGFTSLLAVVSGEELTLDAVLELDDDLVWVFIDRLAKHAKHPVFRDLAGRLRVRKLFRPVPVTPRELEGFLSNPHRAVEVLDQLIVKHVDAANEENAHSYVHYNRPSHKFFEDDAGSAYFIDTRNDSRPASLIREHKDLRHHPAGDHVSRNLFVPREIVYELAKEIRSGPQVKDGSAETAPNEELFEALIKGSRT